MAYFAEIKDSLEKEAQIKIARTWLKFIKAKKDKMHELMMKAK